MLQSLTDELLAKQEHYDRLRPHFISTPKPRSAWYLSTLSS